jgi:hypothetical protein
MVKCSDHAHELYLNPFAYKAHLKQTSKYQQLVSKSLNARITAVRRAIFCTASRDDLGVTADARTYHNLVRNIRGNKEKDMTI